MLTYCQCPQLAGCLFAVHAVHVESVASVVGRADVVCAVFALAALVAYRRAAVDAGTTSFGWLAAAIVLVLLGTLGKEVRCVSLCVCVCVCVCACVCACVCVCVWRRRWLVYGGMLTLELVASYAGLHHHVRRAMRLRHAAGSPASRGGVV